MSVPTHHHTLRLVLATSSPYRKTLLERLRLPFCTIAPRVDESPQTHESPSKLVRRLAEAKAEAARAGYPDALIIGSDQVAACEGAIMNKPRDRTAAIAQLASQSGRRVDFLTGLALVNARTGNVQVDCVSYSVYFRELTRDQIIDYVEAERPLDCAGSFKAEGLGIALVREMLGEDPTALIGLPLIRLVQMLAEEGVDVLRLHGPRP